MKRRFCKWMSVILAMLQITLALGAFPVAAKTVDELVSAGTGNSGWKALSVLDFATDTTTGAWGADKSGNLGTISNGALPLWDSSKAATGNDFMTLDLRSSAVSNTVVWSVTYNVSSTARPIEMSLISAGTRIGIVTVKNDKIQWATDSSGRTKDYSVTASDSDHTLTVIADTQDNSAVLWLDGKKLGDEVPFRTIPAHYENLDMFRIGAAAASAGGTTAPLIKKLSLYDTGATGPLYVTEGAEMETFSSTGRASTYATWTDRNTSGTDKTISYVEKSTGSGDYALKLYTKDDSYSSAPFCDVDIPDITGKGYFEFEFMMDDMPRNVDGRKWVEILHPMGNSDLYNIRVNNEGVLYGTGYSNGDVTLATGLTSDVWYRLTFEINMSTDTADVKLEKADGTGTAQTYAGLPARNADSTLKVYRLGTANKGYNNSLLYDNLTFSKGTDATAYGMMLLRSTNSNIKVSNAYTTSNPKISGCSATSTVADLLSAVVCDTANTTISVATSEGVAMESNERIKGNEIVTVKHNTTDRARTYTVETPVQPVNFYSLEVAGRQYAGSSKILLPGSATVWASVINSTSAEATYYIKGGVEGSESAAQAVTVPASSTKRVKLTGTYTIPDNTTDSAFNLKLYSDAACANLIGDSSIDIATSTVTSMPNIFGDHMVLQRGTEVNIYGLAPTGTAVTAKFGNGQAVTGTAANGEFLVKLPAMQASNVGQTLTVTAGDKTFTYNDVLVGDVFYGSGQSNMVQYYNGGYNDGQQAENAAARAWLEERANWDNVRYHQVSVNVNPAVSVSASNEPWYKVGKEDGEGVKSYANMSSVLYSVADALRGLNIAELDKNVPIAVVRCAVGGSKMSSWVDTDYIEDNKDLAPSYYGYFENGTTFAESGKNYRVTDIYYAMVRPLIPFTFKAAIWYQGESDTDLYGANSVSENPYADAANNMIAMMREKMGYELPYFIVQLPGYGQRDWSRIRLQQWEMYNPENKVYVAVTNDSGEKFGEYSGTENGVHPQDKRVVGDRLARLMAKYLYGEANIPYEAPNHKAADVLSDGSVSVTFNAVNDGVHGKLINRGDLSGFALSEDGSHWTAATATLAADGLSINVKADGITKPKYVSYAGIETASSAPFTYSYPVKGFATAYDTDADSSVDTYLALAPFKEEVTYIRTDDSLSETQFSCKMTFGEIVPKGKAVAIIAFYNEGGKLLKAASADITVSKGVQTVTIPVEAPAYNRYEVFVWSDMTTLKPVIKN